MSSPESIADYLIDRPACIGHLQQTPSGDLVKMGNEVANSERSREKERAEKLKSAVLKGRPAAYGAAEVGEALRQGRVNHLLLQNSFALPQMICKKCHLHVHGQGETCPTCGGQMQALSLEGAVFAGREDRRGDGASRGRCIPGVDWGNRGDAEVFETNTRLKAAAFSGNKENA